MTTITAVIRAFNEEAHIGRLLHGLKQQTKRPDEMILVDSGSSDNTVAVARASGCRVVPIARDDFTFGRALNYGCDAATGEALLIVSAHVYPLFDDYLERLSEPLADPSIAVAYGRQVGDDRTKYSESRLMLRWFPKQSSFDQGHPFSSNANALVRRSAWAEHRYREDLTGLEDVDFAKRAMVAGAKIAYVAEAPVVHVHEESWSMVQNRYRREAIAYKEIFPESKMTLWNASALAVGNVAADYWHALKERKLLHNCLDIVRFRAAQFSGAYLGLSPDRAPEVDLLRRFYYPPELVERSVHQQTGELIDYTSLPSEWHRS